MSDSRRYGVWICDKEVNLTDMNDWENPEEYTGVPISNSYDFKEMVILALRISEAAGISLTDEARRLINRGW